MTQTSAPEESNKGGPLKQRGGLTERYEGVPFQAWFLLEARSTERPTHMTSDVDPSVVETRDNVALEFN